MLRELGGVATRAVLVAATSRLDVDRALESGLVVAVARGRYALPEVEQARAGAHALSGALCLTSAALHHGWAVKTVPDEPHVAVPRKRKVTPQRRTGVTLHYLDLAPEELDAGVTSKSTTLLHCLRMLPRSDALAVADSALREGDRQALAIAVASAHGSGRARVQAIGRLARAEAANPFESALREIALDIPGLRLEPQLLITDTDPWCRPDLVDRDLHLVVEADSFEWHGDRAALARDTRRYNKLVAAGWIVLRFCWEDVMFHPDHVRAVLLAVVARVVGQDDVA